jgi:hypothetical protein
VKSDVIGSNQIGIDLSRKAVRHLSIINFNGKKYLLVSINNAKVEYMRCQCLIYKLRIDFASN